MVAEAGVAAIPVSAFYADASQKSVIRFCFAKTYETLDEAIRRISKSATSLLSS